MTEGYLLFNLKLTKMAVLDFVLNLQFAVGVVVGWKVLPYLIDFGKKFINK